MFELILHPFALGLYVGVFFCIYNFFSEMARRRHLKLKIKELEGTNENLKNTLHTQMSITEKGNRSREEEVDDLKKQNENMRITLATLQTKPGAAELKMLYTFDRAISIMNQRTPGFSGVWGRSDAGSSERSRGKHQRNPRTDPQGLQTIGHAQ